MMPPFTKATADTPPKRANKRRLSRPACAYPTAQRRKLNPSHHHPQSFFAHTRTISSKMDSSYTQPTQLPIGHNTTATRAPSSSSASSNPPSPDLSQYTPQQRQEHYKKLFSRLVEPLNIIDTPEECQTYPQFATEIFHAYLYHTTFTVKV
jgi:hypothetical protein